MLAHGELLPAVVGELSASLDLDPSPRADGPGATASIAHRSWTVDGTRLVLDLARAGERGWVVALFFDGAPPPATEVAQWRVRLRDALEAAGLDLVEVTPADRGEDVFVPTEVAAIDPGFADPRDVLGDDLELLWPRLGIHADADRSVKIAHVQALMAGAAWRSATPQLRRQVAAFLGTAAGA